MSATSGRLATLAMRAFLTAAAVVGLAAFVVAGMRIAASRVDAPAPVTVALATAPDQPIAAESQVFRTDRSMLAIADPLGRLRAAHPRTLATYRVLRAYPGAPPRIPHGLSPSEFRESACKACHERGGYSERFNAYVPVTPHPEMGACLQCHVGDATLMAIPLPGTDPSSRCRQCHTPGGPAASDSALDWRPTAWPSLAKVAPGEVPPPIPHDSPMRVNCIPCHAGPSGVTELQTRHPDRSDCRQCHLQAVAPGALPSESAGSVDAGRGGGA